MSTYRRRGAPETAPPRILRNVRIVAINTIDSVVLATLANALITNQNDQSLYRGMLPRETSEDYYSLLEAKREWFKVADVMEEYDDPGDVATFITSSGVDTDRPDVSYDESHEERFKRNVKGMQIKAECTVEYDANEQPVEVFAGGDETGFGFEDDDDDSSDDDAPRRQAAPVHAVSRGPPSLERAVVVGLWPTLSPSIPLTIAGKLFAGDSSQRVKRYETTREDCYIRPFYDASAGAPRISIADFCAMLRHGPAMHPKAVATIVRSLFPTLYAGALHPSGRGQCVDTVRGPNGVEPLRESSPLSNTVTLNELLHALQTSTHTSLISITHERSVFASTAILALLPQQIATIIDCYGGKRWCDVVARGFTFVQKLYVLLTRLPHALCFTHLKYIECVKLQQAARERLGEHAAESIVAAMRWLAAMPEMQVANYNQLLARNAAARIEPVLPPALRDIVRVAVDIYGSIIKHDLHSGDHIYDNDRRKREASGRGVSSGHMFSVFGNLEGAPPSGTKYDSGYADGTLCIDDYLASLEQREHRPAVRQLSAYADEQDDGGTPDFIPARLDDDRPLTPPRRYECAFDRDIARLSQPCEPKQFCLALRWLVEQGMLLKFTHTGTGPQNRGMRFDMFYEARVWRSQAVVTESIVNLYHRGLADRLAAAEVDYDDDDDNSNSDIVQRYNERVAFRDAARAHLRATLRHQKRQAAAQKMIDSLGDNDKAPNSTQALADDDSAPERMAALAAGVEDFFAPTNDDDDNPSERDERARPLQVPDAVIRARLAGTPLSAEQKEGIWFALRNSLTIFMAPGGSGKTRVAAEIYKSFPPSQIAVCALTAKACEVLTQSIGRVSTIHRLLLKYTLHKQKYKRWQMYMQRLESELASLLATQNQNGELSMSRIAFIRARLAIERLVGCCESVSPVEDVRVVIVDEASLVDINLMRMLLEMLSGSLCKLIVLGDINQLPSIDAGSVLSDLCRAFPHCVQMFTKNFRSKGRSIFELGRAIVLRKPWAAAPDFTHERNLRKLARSTTPANDADRAAADDASLVFLRSSEDTLQGDLRNVLQMLGAFRNGVAPTPEMIEARLGIHIIAHTNVMVKTLNTLCRTLYFGLPTGANKELELQPAMHHKLMLTDKFFFKRNFDDKVQVSNAAYEESMLEDAAVVQPGVDEGGDDSDDEAIAGGSSAVAQLNDMMAAAGAPEPSDSIRTVRIKAFSSEIITLADIYEKPKRIGQRYCICGLCPVLPPQQPGTPFVPSSCVRWPHCVPLRRRRFGDPSRIRFHDQNMRHGENNGSVRMAVVRSQNGAYKQFNVEKRLMERSAWDYGFATTVTRFQGSGTKTIILVMPHHSQYADMALAYTSVLRAELRFIFLGDEEVWRRVVQKLPFTRRSEMWMLMACGVVHAHQALGVGAPHVDALANRLGIPLESRLEREIMRLDRTIGERDRDVVWTYFDRVRAEVLKRAGLCEL